MRTLYYLSYVPTAPLWALSWVFYGIAWLLCWVGNLIHDKTTYRAWRVLHRRECAKP